MNDMSNTIRFVRALRGKSNTCKTARPETKARKIAAIEAHLERHPNDGASRAHLSKIVGGK